MRNGTWFYQHYHTPETGTALATAYIGPHAAYEQIGSSALFMVRGTKEFELPADQVAWAIDFEFNLPWPGGQRVGRSREVMDAYRAALAMERIDLPLPSRKAACPLPRALVAGHIQWFTDRQQRHARQ